jgi:SET domain-containing protein
MTSKPIAYPTYLKKIRGKGWGAFCSRKIPKKAVFNVTTLLPLTVREARLMSGSSLEPYWYEFGTKSRAIALGLGSIMNHSDEPNCSFYYSKTKRTLTFYALRDIPAHEELTHDYCWSAASYRAYGVKREPAGAKARRQGSQARPH